LRARRLSAALPRLRRRTNRDCTRGVNALSKHENETDASEEINTSHKKEDLECLNLLNEMQYLRMEAEYIDSMLLSLQANPNDSDPEKNV
jgi:hypothetical protein